LDLGYIFCSSHKPHALGHPELDVNLFAAPTGKHFDPHAIDILVYDPERGAQRQILFHPVEAEEYQVCCGRLTLLDFDQKEVEAFTFGGQLVLENYPDYTYCQINSPAPIFHICGFGEDESVLASEYEAEIARLQAHFDTGAFDLDDYLAIIDPVTLFLALTKNITQLFDKFPPINRNDRYWLFRHNLKGALYFVTPDGILPPETLGADELIKSINEKLNHESGKITS
jgi:hypothetical protein